VSLPIQIVSHPLNPHICSGRRLPQRPPGEYPASNGPNGYTNGYSSPPFTQKVLPPDPPIFTNGTSSYTPPQMPAISFPTPDFSSNMLDWSPPRTSFGSITDVGMRSSERPHVPDRTLGGTPEEPLPRSPSSIEDMYASPSELRPPNSLQPAHGFHSTPSLYPGAVASQAQLNRKQSNASAVSSVHPGIARNTSVTTTATTNTTRSSAYSDTLHFRAPSSATSTLDRGNSVGSYVSRAESGDYPPQPPAKTERLPPQQTYAPQPSSSQAPVAGSSGRTWQEREKDIFQQLQDIKRPLQVHEGYDDEYYDEDEPSEDGDDRFFNPALLSHIAVRLRDKVSRGTHVKGSIPYERAFTGRDIVVGFFIAALWLSKFVNQLL
jgi:RHO1 GDP-GTP exchange protein 1/2